MDDNARPHQATLVDEFLESEDIKRIPWPANSPGLNPIENLWDYLGRAIARRHPPPRDVNGLKTAFLEEWSLIPQTVINNVISSLKTRCDMCVRVREIIFHIKFQRFQDDGNVSRCYSTGRLRVTTPNEDRYLAITAKETDEAQHQTCLVRSLQLLARQFQGKQCTDA
ncbi:transposable element Tcb2 transposase [Trichonephila clavipes]|nr:transposable element Tcb2 transposase [Trichonephila clavipes]